MNITFLGAAREVTGSNILIETEKNIKILVDCGLIQGKKAEEEKNKDPFLYDPKDIDFVLLTHAHIDHSGRIPKLYNEGFRGKVFCTKATKELCEIMLPDSGHIQETEADWENRKRSRQNKKLIEPLYTKEDAEKSLEVFEEVKYGEIIEFSDGIRVRFNDAGHMLGSSILELWVTENGETTKTVFTGDLGSGKNVLLDDPDKIKRTDYLVMESTYGNRIHPDIEGRGKKFLEIVSKTLKRGGTVVIPSFAVGRTQEIVFEINKLKDKYYEDDAIQKEYKEVMESDVYIDSPLATSATEVFSNNLDYFDESIQDAINKGCSPLDFPGLKFTKSVDESKALNELKSPKIIISASGMCDAGRIKHHLKHNIWDPNNTILFVGYQAPGTLGRRIVEGEKKIKIFGEDIAVNAQIEYIEGYSGHADQNELLEFLSGFEKKPKSIFLVHGDYESQLGLKNKISEKYRSEIYIPRFGSSYELTAIVRKVQKVRHLALKDIRDEKLQFVDTMDNLGNSLNITLGKLRDYIIADKTFNEDKKIWSKEEEYLQKLYKISNAFSEELKFLINNKLERKTKETDLEEPYEIPDFGRRKNLLKEDPYSFSKDTLKSKVKEDNEINEKEKNLKNEPKSIKINGTLNDPLKKKLEEIKRKTANLEKDHEIKQEKVQKAEENKEQIITINPISQEENKIKENEEAELARLDKELQEEIEKEKQVEKNNKSIENLLKEIEEANEKLEKEKVELQKLKEKKEKPKTIQEENKKGEIVSEATILINELSEEINKLDEENVDDELIIARIFAKIAKIENLDNLSDEDVKRIKKEIKKMEDKINNE